MQQIAEPRLAVLIDADNVPSSNLREMMEEIAKYGVPTFKRIYGDWTKSTVSRWKPLMLEHAITPVQQYSYTTGKNATDAAMIIDAMDILYTGRVDGFCIISSDSDFTRLATRLREAGMKVIGMGQYKTPAPFIAACEKFIYIEILKSNAEEPVATETAKPEEEKDKDAAEQTTATPPPIRKADKKLVKLLTDSVADLSDEGGWVFLGELGNLLLKKQPDFDPRNYGFKKLVSLIKSIKSFETDERLSDKGNGNIKHVYLRQREQPKPRQKKEATV